MSVLESLHQTVYDLAWVLLSCQQDWDEWHGYYVRLRLGRFELATELLA